jgi:hypothetical protein
MIRVLNPDAAWILAPLLSGDKISSEIGRKRDVSMIQTDFEHALSLGLAKKDGALIAGNLFSRTFIGGMRRRSGRKSNPGKTGGKPTDDRTIDMTGVLKAFRIFAAANPRPRFVDFAFVEHAPNLPFRCFPLMILKEGAMTGEHRRTRKIAFRIDRRARLIGFTRRDAVLRKDDKPGQLRGIDSRTHGQVARAKDGFWFSTRMPDKARKGKTRGKTARFPGGKTVRAVVRGPDRDESSL